MIFLSKHISLYALGRIRWILDIIWPLNQHFKLKNQRNWLKQVPMLKFWSLINCFLMHWTKKLTLALSDSLCVMIWQLFWYVLRLHILNTYYVFNYPIHRQRTANRGLNQTNWKCLDRKCQTKLLWPRLKIGIFGYYSKALPIYFIHCASILCDPIQYQICSI